MIKVLYLPLNYGVIIQTGMYDAFRQSGCHLKVFDYFKLYNKTHDNHKVRKELIRQVGEWQPDWIHMQIQHTTIIDDNTLLTIKQRWRHIKVTQWNCDVRSYIQRPYKEMSRICDYNLICSTGQLQMYRHSLGNNVGFLQTGYDPKLYYPDNAKRKFDYDVVFVGNSTHQENYPGRSEREAACAMLQAKFGSRFALHGSGWPKSLRAKGSLNQRKLTNLYHRSFCLLSVSHFNDLNHYFSDRLLMCMASGRPTVTYRFPQWESYFTDNCDLVVANTIEQIPAKVQYLLNNRGLAEYIGKSGAAKVYAEHTYFSRVQELMKLVGFK